MSMFGKILVPVDGSPPSDAAVEFAVRFAIDQGAEIIFVNVCEVARVVAMLSAPTVTVDPSYALTAEREGGDEALDRAAMRARQARIPFVTIHENGVCVDTILSIVRREEADAIVIGSHGRTGIARALLGSVAEGILRKADVPVIVTRVAPKLALVRDAQGRRVQAGSRVLAAVAAATSDDQRDELDPIC